MCVCVWVNIWQSVSVTLWVTGVWKCKNPGTKGWIVIAVCLCSYVCFLNVSGSIFRTCFHGKISLWSGGVTQLHALHSWWIISCKESMARSSRLAAANLQNSTVWTALMHLNMKNLFLLDRNKTAKTHKSCVEVRRCKWWLHNDVNVAEMLLNITWE